MPRTAIIATGNDLAANFRRLEARRALKYVRCGAGNWLDGPEPDIYSSSEQLPDLRVADETNRFPHVCHILDCDSAVSAERRTIGSATPNPYVKYQLRLDEGKPAVQCTIGGVLSSGVVRYTTVSLGDITQTKGVALYRLVTRTLSEGFEDIGGHLFGSEAIRRIENGSGFLIEGLNEVLTNEHLIAWRIEREKRKAHIGPRMDWNQTATFLDWEVVTEDSETFEDLDEEADEEESDSDEGDGYEEPFDFEAKSLDYFRSSEERADFSHLTLVQSYFARSGFELLTFVNSDLTGSRIAWTDWLDCDFRGAVLEECLICGIIVGCNFDGASFDGSDLRHSTFEECSFGGASFEGAKLLDVQGKTLALTDAQCQQVDWRNSPGPEPFEG